MFSSELANNKPRGEGQAIGETGTLSTGGRVLKD